MKMKKKLSEQKIYVNEIQNEKIEFCSVGRKMKENLNKKKSDTRFL